MSNIYRLIAFYNEAQKQLDFFNVFFFSYGEGTTSIKVFKPKYEGGIYCLSYPRYVSSLLPTGNFLTLFADCETFHLHFR